MKVYRLGKLQMVSIFWLFVAITTLWLVSLYCKGVFTRNVHTSYIQHHLAEQEIVKTTVDPMMDNKLKNIKIYLNFTSRVDSAVYPANSIGRYLLLNTEICKGVDFVDIITIVHTAPDNLERRQRIRDSFVKQSLFYPFEIRVVFLLGKTSNRTLAEILKLEHAKHKDTVMGDFLDHYHNLTLKGVMGYHWISQYCSNSRFVLKIDDDVLINMFKLLYSFLNHMSRKRKSIFCNLWDEGTMPILRSGKWKVPSHIFSSQKTFPYNYCSGFTVLITSDLIMPMYEAATKTPFFWIDDVYLFGMLPSVVGNVTFYHYSSNMTLDHNEAINCTMTKGILCPIFATHVSDQSYWSYWEMITSMYISSTWKVQYKTIQ